MINGNALPIPGWDGGDGNSAYLDKTLRHHAVEVHLDDRVSGRTVARLWARAAIVAALAFVVQLPFAIAGLVAAFSSDGYGAGSGLGGFSLVMLYDAPLIFVVVLLFSKLTEPIGEWRVLLHDRSEQDAQSTYHKICGVVVRRGFPFQVGFRRLDTGFGAAQSNGRLVLRSGDCQATISVFRYGDSMYLGWQMWRTRRGWQLIARFLGDVVGSVFGQSDLTWAMLRTENVRAMREAVHSVCREGLVTAIEREYVPVEFGFGGGQPPQLEHRPTTTPAGVPQAPGGPLQRAVPQQPTYPGGPSNPGPSAPMQPPAPPQPQQPAGPPTVGGGTWSPAQPPQ